MQGTSPRLSQLGWLRLSLSQRLGIEASLAIFQMGEECSLLRGGFSPTSAGPGPIDSSIGQISASLSSRSSYCEHAKSFGLSANIRYFQRFNIACKHQSERSIWPRILVDYNKQEGAERKRDRKSAHAQAIVAALSPLTPAGSWNALNQ